MSALTEPGLGTAANPSVPHLDVDPFSMEFFDDPYPAHAPHA